MKPRLKGWWLIFASLALSPLFQVFPLGPELAVWRPVVPMLVVGFWAYVAPAHIGPFWGFLYGFVLESMFHMPLMQLALPCALLALLMQYVFMKLRSYSAFQQALYVSGATFVLVVVSYPLSLQVFSLATLTFVLQASVSTFVIWLLLIIWFEPWCRRHVVATE